MSKIPVIVDYKGFAYFYNTLQKPKFLKNNF